MAAARLSAPEGGEEAAARLWPIYGGQGGGCSAVLKGGEEAVTRRAETRSPFEKTQLSVVSARRARTT